MERKHFFQWFDNYLNHCQAFITLVANSLFLKAQEGGWAGKWGHCWRKMCTTLQTEVFKRKKKAKCQEEEEKDDDEEEKDDEEKEVEEE